MSTRYAGRRIRRGVIAADRFTQISNALFRDPRISLKAKGLFGLLSTHRDGYGITAAGIAGTQTKEGVSAIESGLRELERFGYLERERERRPDGTLGVCEYFITDSPVEVQTNEETPGKAQTKKQNRRSAPNRENPVLDEPGLDEPGVDDRKTKNTKGKKTKEKNTVPSVRPLPGAGDAREEAPEERTDGRTDGREHTHHQPDDNPSASGAASPPAGGGGKNAGNKPTTPRPRPAEPVQDSVGVRLLQAAASAHPDDPRWRQLTGKVLTEQGAKVDALLARGFPEDQIRGAVTGRPLPDVILKTVGGIISHRLEELGSGRPHLPEQDTPRDQAPGRGGLPPLCPDHERIQDGFPGEVPAAQRVLEDAEGRSYPCPRCHPKALSRAPF